MNEEQQGVSSNQIDIDEKISQFICELKQIHFLSVNDYYENLKALIVSYDSNTIHEIKQGLTKHLESVLQGSDIDRLLLFGRASLKLHTKWNNSSNRAFHNILAYYHSHPDAYLARKMKALCHHNVGKIHVSSKEFSAAIDCFTAAISYDEKYISAYNNMGLCYRQLGFPEKATQIYQQGLRLCPTYLSLHYNLGNAYFSMNDYERAIEYYTSSIQINPMYRSSYHNRMICYMNMNMYLCALADRIALNAIPNDSHAPDPLFYSKTLLSQIQSSSTDSLWLSILN